jgi:hypothetical protein
MLSSAFGIAAVTVGLAVASYVAYRIAIDKARDAALDFAKKELNARYPEVDRDELDALVGEGLALAKESLNRDTEKDARL